MVNATRRQAKKKSKKRSLVEASEELHLSRTEFVNRMSRVDPVVYSAKNLRNEAGDPLEFTQKHIFQQQILRDFSPNIAVKKSSQVGLTTITIAKALFLCSHTETEEWRELFQKDTAGIRIIYTFPTARDVEDFSAMRFRPMVLSSEELVRAMGGKRGADAVGRKQIYNSSVIFRGAQKESQAISNPADLIINDEYDFSDLDIIEMFESRLTHSEFKWWWKFSTPTLPNFGIDEEFRQSNQFIWRVICIHCRKDQEIKWPRNVKKKKIRGKTIKYWGCVKCGKELDRTYGRWEARYPNRAYHGYHVTPMIAPWIQPRDLDKAKKTYKKIKNFYNFALGEAYADGDALLTREHLLATVTFGRGYEPALDRHVFMGIDQGDVLHYVLARGTMGRREVFRVGTATSFDEISALIYNYNVSLAVMDALPNHHAAKKFAQDHYGRVHLAYYKQFDKEEDVKESNEVEFGLLLDRTGTLDISAEAWKTGKCKIMINDLEFSRIPPTIDDPKGKESFIQQMTNMVRDEIEDKRTQKSRAVWVKTGPDHYRHADSYCHVAFLERNGGEINLDGLYVQPNKALVTAGSSIGLVIPGRTSGFHSRF